MAATWHLPSNVLATSIEVMRPYGMRGREGLVMWLGQSADEVVRVTHLVKFSGTGFTASSQHLALSFRAMARLTDLADDLGAYLVGQIHSHPGTFIDLSPVDIQFGIRVVDYLSVVCPWYSQNPGTRLEHCGIHVYEKTDYRRLSSAEACQRIRITNNDAPLLTCEVPHDE